MTHPLPELRRVWWSIELPGYRPHLREYATYSPFEHDALPPIERDLDDDLDWLTAQSPARHSLADEADAPVTRRATLGELRSVWPASAAKPPDSFTAFVASLEPRRRLRSATACYLDLAEFAVPVDGGGTLLHFLSDQQWVLHWLLFVGDDGRDAVVVTNRPFGFDVPDEAPRVFEPRRHSALCAESFSEFLYRFWIENEIWYALTRRRAKLTSEHRRYVEHYT